MLTNDDLSLFSVALKDPRPADGELVANERGVEPNVSCFGHCDAQALEGETALKDFAAARKEEAAGRYASAALLYRKALDEV